MIGQVIVDQVTDERFEEGLSQEISDAKLLSRVRGLIREEHAGFVASAYGNIQDACIEPKCSCNFDVCGPFREKP